MGFAFRSVQGAPLLNAGCGDVMSLLACILAHFKIFRSEVSQAGCRILPQLEVLKRRSYPPRFGFTQRFKALKFWGPG